MASGNYEIIKSLKKDVAIWNINSFAEFYMQIAEKYKKDYVKALELFRKERARYVAELSKISGIRVIPSQANYVTIEIKEKFTAKELTKNLLLKYNLFIKDLTSKVGGQYVRIAVRAKEDNDKLICALNKEFN